MDGAGGVTKINSHIAKVNPQVFFFFIIIIYCTVFYYFTYLKIITIYILVK